MEILKALSGPLLGAIIGYFTNFIAVKMLFYPRREIRLFGWRLPFTPGAIPKGQPRLAKAIGAVIENHLLTKSDIETTLLSEQIQDQVADLALKKLSCNIRSELCVLTGLSEEAYQAKKKTLCQRTGDQIVHSIEASGVTETVLNELAESMREKTQGTGWRLLVNSKTLGSLMGYAKERLDRGIAKHGTEYIAPLLERELTAIDSGTGMELLFRLNQNEDKLRNAVKKGYGGLVRDNIEPILSSFHIAGLIEDKINAMSVEELEKLVWNVMRKELNTIISLGALIGFVLGLLNMVFR